MAASVTKHEWRVRARANSQGLRIDHARIRSGIARFVERAQLELEQPPAWVVATSMSAVSNTQFSTFSTPASGTRSSSTSVMSRAPSRSKKPVPR